MRQLVQSVRDGSLHVIESPTPEIGPTQVLVATTRSLVSAGTEKAVRQLAQASLLSKARARPDLVRQVVRKARTEGLAATRSAVERRLADDMPLGYSATGVAVSVGDAVAGIEPGMRVATGGSGHADLQVVAGLLAVPVPDGVTDEEAAFATVGAIALHGFRLAEVSLGERVLVVGLGLVGQLAARIAMAAGCRVTAVDLRPYAVDAAVAAGIDALVDDGDDTTAALLRRSAGQGFDGVLVCAATPSNAPLERAVESARDRGTVIVVGDVGMKLDRRPLFASEVTLRVARSYGPGRYEHAYEDLAIDFPPGQVRWTEGRNLAAVLDLIDRDRIDVSDLVTHRFAFAEATRAYDLLNSGDPYLGIQLLYGEDASASGSGSVPVSTPSGTSISASGRRAEAGATPSDAAATRPVPFPPVPDPRLGFIGAGGFAAGTLVPAFAAAGLTRLEVVASASGRSAARLAERAGFARVAGSADEVIADPAVDVVVVATPHDSHATLVAAGLRGGKHVFTEKPLALSFDELDDVREAWTASGRQLMVGFNRRWAPMVADAVAVLGRGHDPLLLTYRINAGAVPDGHWYADRRHGGRLLGEACHFVDLCRHLVGHDVVEVDATAVTGPGQTEQLLAPQFVLTLRFVDASVATIHYSSGAHPATPKERVEVLGGGHTVVIDDFRVLTIDGRTTKGAQDKGHRAQMAAFRRALASGGDPALAESALASMAATLGAAAALGTLGPVTLLP